MGWDGKAGVSQVRTAGREGVDPDWVLIYAATEERVHFERTGTHEELFEN
jgi:mRNA-degrading endonuclease YafQ of YafQ-DinJ toxin-antitoxin module